MRSLTFFSFGMQSLQVQLFYYSQKDFFSLVMEHILKVKLITGPCPGFPLTIKMNKRNDSQAHR
jgi:hypothetical protein